MAGEKEAAGWAGAVGKAEEGEAGSGEGREVVEEVAKGEGEEVGKEGAGAGGCTRAREGQGMRAMGDVRQQSPVEARLRYDERGDKSDAGGYSSVTERDGGPIRERLQRDRRGSRSAGSLGRKRRSIKIDQTKSARLGGGEVGVLTGTVVYKNNEMNGEAREYTDQGRLHAVWEYHNGQKDGISA